MVSTQLAVSTVLPKGYVGTSGSRLVSTSSAADGRDGRRGICFNSLKDLAADALLWHAPEALKNKQKIGYNRDSRRLACG